MNIERLIELLTKEVDRFWFNEMTTHLNDEEGEELDELLHEYELYKKDKELQTKT